MERDYESAPKCYIVGYYGRCHRMRVRATSGVGPASATREVWVRLGDAFEFQARATGPGVLVLEWRQRPEVSYYCPESGHDLWYRPVTRQDDPDNPVSHYRPHERRFGPETTEVELTGLFPDHEYYVWMRERYASGCGFGNGAQDWVKSRVWTEGHGAALSVPRVSLTFPDPENPDDFNAPVRGETTVVEGEPAKFRILVDLPDAEYFPSDYDGVTFRLVYTWGKGTAHATLSESQGMVARTPAQRHGKRWHVDYDYSFPDGASAARAALRRLDRSRPRAGPRAARRSRTRASRACPRTSSRAGPVSPSTSATTGRSFCRRRFRRTARPSS